MTYLTKMKERQRFIAEFVRRLSEAPPGQRVYMRVGDVFKDADIHNLDEWRAARLTAVFGNDEDEDVGPMTVFIQQNTILPLTLGRFTTGSTRKGV